MTKYNIKAKYCKFQSFHEEIFAIKNKRYCDTTKLLFFMYNFRKLIVQY